VQTESAHFSSADAELPQPAARNESVAATATAEARDLTGTAIVGTGRLPGQGESNSERQPSRARV